MKKSLIVLVLSLVATIQLNGAVKRSGAVKQLNISSDWIYQPMDVASIKDKSKCPPPLEDDEKTKKGQIDDLIDDDMMSGEFTVSTRRKRLGKAVVGFAGSDGSNKHWSPKKRSLSDVVPSSANFKGEQKAFGVPVACWYRRKVKIPAEWKGSFVLMELDLHCMDIVVFVNGKRAGVLMSPVGKVEVSPFLKYGEENTFQLFATNQGIGTGTANAYYHGRDDQCGKTNFKSPAMLRVHSDVILDDVWMKPSWREKSITATCQMLAGKACTAKIDLEISEESSGKVVKQLTKDVSLAAGTNSVDLAEAWADFHAWETTDPFLYRCTPKITIADKECEAPESFIFGFREVWRERGQIMFNGHVQSVRGFCTGNLFGLDLSDPVLFLEAGYNAIYTTHQHESLYVEDKKKMEQLARAGILMFGGAPSINVFKMVATDPGINAQYRRYLEHWGRSVRNYPSVIGVSAGVNMMCAASWTMGICDMGKARLNADDQLTLACKLIKEYHPNCLTFCHGDGNICDIGCSNFYFNFTPLQEREEWYSDWFDRSGRENTIPYYPAEYDQPYYGSWFGGTQPSMTEFCAIYFGEDAYREEDERMLTQSRAFAYSKAGKYFGGWAPGEEQGKQHDLYDFNPMGWKLHELFATRVNRAWRAWHCRISPMYLQGMSLEPSPSNVMLRAQSVGNWDLCTFIGGKPDEGKQRFADRTHAYLGGDTITKSIVAIWDGLGEEKLSADWKLESNGRLLDSGKLDLALKQGDVLWAPFAIKTPKVSEKTKCRLVVNFAAKHLNPGQTQDTFDFELYPAFKPLKDTKPVALFDPRGETAKDLEVVGVKYRAVKSLTDLSKASETYLMIGRRALDTVCSTNVDGKAFCEELAKLAPLAPAGKRIIMMSQSGDVWHKLGLIPENCMPRKLFNVSLPGVEDDELAHWKDSPLPMRESSCWNWTPDWGLTQFFQRGGRGWRGRHTHALSLATLLIPQRTGFRPLIRGEFDMAYSSLMRATVGKGAITLCALDFEGGRVGPAGDPAATKVYKAMLSDWFADQSTSEAKVFVSGGEAQRLAECLGLDFSAYSGKAPKGSVILVGDDSPLGMDDLREAANSGVKSLVVANNDLAKEGGMELVKVKKTVILWHTRKQEFEEDELMRLKRPKSSVSTGSLDDVDGDEFSLEEVKKEKKPKRPKGVAYNDLPDVWFATTNVVENPFVRTHDTAAFDKFPFAGVGLSMLRWRESSRPLLLKSNSDKWTVTGDGVFAISSDGMILFDQINPFRVMDERKRSGGKGDPVGLLNYSPTLENNMRRHSLVLENWGVRPDDKMLSRCFMASEKDLYWSAAYYDPYGYVYW